MDEMICRWHGRCSRGNYCCGTCPDVDLVEMSDEDMESVYDTTAELEFDKEMAKRWNN